ncbi:hypothetical protein EVAR_2547_1 [Eumeta japonica]|uniref:Uncharacterized protein n=1 Tax=Eumeta variegata TaxID=151549 RepID=A0A4C1SNQ9_EUMVA|nr:hypothetical protein EVAR_2547_1 [Eumeta japonica]
MPSHESELNPFVRAMIKTDQPMRRHTYVFPALDSYNRVWFLITPPLRHTTPSSAQSPYLRSKDLELGPSTPTQLSRGQLTTVVPEVTRTTCALLGHCCDRSLCLTGSAFFPISCCTPIGDDRRGVTTRSPGCEVAVPEVRRWPRCGGGWRCGGGFHALTAILWR